MKMTVAELMEELEMMNPDAEVRLAFQPSWPFQYTIDGVYDVPGRSNDPEPDPNMFPDEEDYLDARDDWEDRQDAPEEDVVYIAEGGQLYEAPYLPGAAAAAIGWGR